MMCVTLYVLAMCHVCECRSKLESLSKTLKQVKAESSREIEVLEQGNFDFLMFTQPVVYVMVFIMHTLYHCAQLFKKLRSRR